MKRKLQITAEISVILMILMSFNLSAQPRPSEIINQARNQAGTWYEVGKTTFEYLPNNQTIQTEYGWIPPDWTVMSRTITTVDEHDNMTEFILELLQDGDWVPMVHWAYVNTYQNGRLTEVKQGTPELIELGFFTSREVYEYDVNGKLTQITQQLSLVSTWTDIGRTVYHYQGNDIGYVTIESYDEASSSWEYDQKTVHTYTSGKLFSLESLEWDVGDWAQVALHEYSYNVDGSINHIIEKGWRGSAYEIRRRYVYFYGGTSVNELSFGLPEAFSLSNFPNPFNPETTIQFSLQTDVQVNLDIFDVLGRKVRSLIAGEVRQAGVYQLKWDGKDDAGRIQPSGIFIYRLSTPGRTLSKTCLLIK